jgi:hypothetical protein
LLREVQEGRRDNQNIPQIILKVVEKLLEDKGAKAGNISRSYLQEVLETAIHRIVQTKEALSIPDSKEANNDDTLIPKSFYWGGAFHLAPESFKFPSVCLFSGWTH